jgi:hypothetical protein
MTRLIRGIEKFKIFEIALAIYHSFQELWIASRSYEQLLGAFSKNSFWQL